MNRRLAAFILGLLVGVAASLTAVSATHQVGLKFVREVQSERLQEFSEEAKRYLEWNKKTLAIPIEIGSLVLFPEDKELPVGWMNCDGGHVSFGLQEVGPIERIRAVVGDVVVTGRKAVIHAPLLAAPSGTRLRWIAYVGRLDF